MKCAPTCTKYIETQTEEWVACGRCYSWYHKQCVGIGFRFGRKTPFLCCGKDDSST